MTLVLRLIWPYALAALGFAAGWKTQGYNTTAVAQEFAQFKLDAQKASQDQQAKQSAITKEFNDAIPLYVQALHDYYRRNPVIRMLPPAKRDPEPNAGHPGQPRPGSTDVILAAEDWRKVEQALEQCGETTLLFVQLRDAWRAHRKGQD